MGLIFWSWVQLPESLLYPVQDVRLRSGSSKKSVGTGDLPSRDIGADLNNSANSVTLRNEFSDEEKPWLKTGQSFDASPIETDASVAEKSSVHVQILPGRCHICRKAKIRISRVAPVSADDGVLIDV